MSRVEHPERWYGSLAKEFYKMAPLRLAMVTIMVQPFTYEHATYRTLGLFAWTKDQGTDKVHGSRDPRGVMR